MRIYLDNAASTPISQEVMDVMIKVFTEGHANPSSIHADGRKLRSVIEQARKMVANGIGASIGEIFFTSGGTESNNMALKCAVNDLGVKHIITSPIEHHCVLHSVEHLQKKHNVKISMVQVDSMGHVVMEDLERLLVESSEKTLVSLMHANNEVGTLLDLERVAALCELHDAYFHSDTVQSMAHEPIDVNKFKVHFLSGSAHKFHGPKGTGFVYINNEIHVNPLIDGGSQERNMRAGTENAAGIAGLAKAFELALTNMEKRRIHIEHLRSHMINRLKREMPDVAFNGDWTGQFLYTVLNVAFPPCEKGPMLLMHLDIQGISVSGGSACSSGADVGSHVMNAIGVDPARKSVRFSFSHYNSVEEIDTVIDKLKQLVPSGSKEQMLAG